MPISAGAVPAIVSSPTSRHGGVFGAAAIGEAVNKASVAAKRRLMVVPV